MKTFAFLLVVVVGAAFVATVAGEDTAAETTKAADAAAGKADGGGKTMAITAACFKDVKDAKDAEKPLADFAGDLGTSADPATPACADTSDKTCKVTFTKTADGTKYSASAHACSTDAVADATKPIACTLASDSKTLTCLYHGATLDVATMKVGATELAAFKAAGGPPPPPPPPTTTGGPAGDKTTGGGSPEESLAVSIKASMTIVFLTVLASSVSALAGPSV